MKVVFFARPDWGAAAGGPTIQVQHYARWLRELGHQVDVHATWDQPGGRYDVAHVVNIDLPLIAAHQVAMARRVAARVVLSPIHHPDAWIRDVHRNGPRPLAKAGSKLLSPRAFEISRDFLSMTRSSSARGYSREIASSLSSVGVRRTRILSCVDALFFLSHGERDHLLRDFRTPDLRVPSFIVRNGADAALASWPSRREDLLICVGRIEARKNQLALIDAVRDLDVEVVFIGHANDTHRAYVRQFITAINAVSNCTWIPGASPAVVSDWMCRAHVHVLPSRAEVAPLVDLEAFAHGCKVVSTTRGFTSEQLGAEALYWDPQQPRATLAEVIVEAKRPRSKGKHRQVVQTWASVCSDLLDAYTTVLGSERPPKRGPGIS